MKRSQELMVCISIPLSLPNSLTRYMIITSDSHVCTDTLTHTLAFFPRNTARSLAHDSGRRSHTLVDVRTIAGADEAHGTSLFTLEWLLSQRISSRTPTMSGCSHLEDSRRALPKSCHNVFCGGFRLPGLEIRGRGGKLSVGWGACS